MSKVILREIICAVEMDGEGYVSERPVSELVRCIECKYYGRNTARNEKPIRGWCKIRECSRTGDDYCSDGKRRVDNDG